MSYLVADENEYTDNVMYEKEKHVLFIVINIIIELGLIKTRSLGSIIV
jgi:hypothetical protein